MRASVPIFFANLGNALLEQDCTVFGSDMRIRTAPSGIYTYPDA